MKRVFSPILYYCVVIPISLLPFPLLYLVSGFIFFLSYHVVKYRRKVVQENLRKSFPEKSDDELKKIEIKFYRHFGDFVVEMIKSVTISKNQIIKRCKIKNPEMVNKYYDEGKSVIVTCGHYNNWEYYAVGLSPQMQHLTMAAYLPLNNPFFNKKLFKCRERFGLKLWSIKNLTRFYSSNDQKPRLSVLLNDQSPADPSKAYWNKFLNQDTPWLYTPEKIAKKYNIPVLFGCIKKIKRGYYEVIFHPITENPTSMKDGEITERHTRYLEDLIKEAPEYWLWSHRRWKHKKQETIN